MTSWALDHLEKMRAFETIVRSGSLLRASRELGVSQPALSRLVTNLEEVSGKKLLVRSRLGCKPTPEGKQIVNFFEKILPMAKDLEQKVISRDDVAGVLSVGTFESFAVTWWPQFLKLVSKDFPGLKLIVRTADNARHREKLLHGALDLVIEACPDEHERLTSMKVGSDYFGFYVAKGSKEENLPLVYVPHAKDDKGRFLADLLRDRGILAQEIYELDSFSAVHEFIATGIGIGALPERLAEKSVKRDLIRRGTAIKGAFGEHSICASFVSENRNDRRIVSVLRALKIHLAQ